MEEPSSQTYTPQVADECKPKVGQEFETIEAAYAFYNAYAREAGLSVRMSNSKKRPGTNELVWKQIVCYKEGETNERYQKEVKHTVERSGERNRGIVCVGCKAKVTLVKQKCSLNWAVSYFVEGHNHELATPNEVHLLRSHRQVSSARKALLQLQQLPEENVPTNQQERVAEIGYSSPQHSGDIERDNRYYGIELGEEVKEIETETLIEFFTLEKEKNHDFYFELEKDKEDKLVGCFWADPYSRRSYFYFGDVVVFDTTCDTNKHGMIFASLSGVNHHGQTIIFGCGFIRDKTIESFLWFFNQWMNAMPKGAPQLIITDYNLAITKAIAQVLPKSFHHYCVWHILNKFSEKINPLICQDLLKNVILNSETVEEFETTWWDMLQTSKLKDNVWLCQMYEVRNRWVPTYVKHIFAAGMSSIQSAENSHLFLKRYISEKNSFIDFIIRFSRALQHLRYEELRADHSDISEKPKLKSLWPIEIQMEKVFTRKKFQTFQDEIFESHAYIVNTLNEDEANVSYTIQRVDECSSSRSQELIYDKSEDFVSCSCQQFEHKGIPCKHMLAYFRIKQLVQLPTQYILQRWTRGAKAGPICDKRDGEINDIHDQSLMSRHSRLSQLLSIVIDNACLTVEGSNLLQHMLEDIHKKLKISLRT